MKKDEILCLYRYNAWANARILRATANVTLEEFLAPGPFSHGGLRNTLVHALTAEWIWRNRWEGASPTKLLDRQEFSTFDALYTRWADEEKALMNFVVNLEEQRLDQAVHYTTTGGIPYENTLWHLMLHLVNHGTQHRSEAAAMLTGFGHSPGDIDLIVFLRSE